LLDRKDILPEPELPKGVELVSEGQGQARDWQVGPSAFLTHTGHRSEAEFKRARAASARIMQHAQMGFRDAGKSRRAYAEIYERCRQQGATVDRYGISLDWSMGYPAERRDTRFAGTGLVLNGPEDFAELARMAPVAAHFGDFVLGFPAAVENTRAALSAGSTSIGNLGQFFTFRLPGWDDDVATARATVTALALIAAQKTEVLVHSNLDDGFAALFTDTACSLGAVLIEKHIIEDLIGAPLSHCYGHHFTDPMKRLAFHLALGRVSDTPGTMVYGNTMAYRRDAAGNFASLASYLLTDIIGQMAAPTGHAINPVPVTENVRIPDIDEIVDAQCFASRLIEHAGGLLPAFSLEAATAIADILVREGRRFRDRVLAGLEGAGIDLNDPFEMLLAIRRIGSRRLEELYGPGRKDEARPRGRAPAVASPTLDEIEELAHSALAEITSETRGHIAGAGLSALIATMDVHEHSKLLVEQVFGELGVTIIDGGVSVDADDLAAMAAETGADVIALSTYNGVALEFAQALLGEVEKAEIHVPLLIGGRLNQIPRNSNSSLPVEVEDELVEAGAVVCRNIADAALALAKLAQEGSTAREPRRP